MSQRKIYGLLAILISLAFITSACGGSPDTPTGVEEQIATSVAQTVAAQNKVATPTVISTAIPTITQLVLPGSGTAIATVQPRPTNPPVPGGEAACMKASLVSETVPDGTILKPGEQFTKVWSIRNDSTCVWSTSYKIVFWDGDLMGGAYVYNFPQQALPGDVVEVPLVLIAPLEDGEYQSQWKLQTPGGASFGVGYDTPFWTEIIVSSSDKVEYGVTSVTYTVDRNPLTGCPANVFYTISATITVNGPVNVTYNWRKSDGAFENKETLKFTEAGSKTVSFVWSIHIGSATNERWAQLFTIAPVEQDFGKATFLYTCAKY
jgi:hypothetical protein